MQQVSCVRVFACAAGVSCVYLCACVAGVLCVSVYRRSGKGTTTVTITGHTLTHARTQRYRSRELRAKHERIRLHLHWVGSAGVKSDCQFDSTRSPSPVDSVDIGLSCHMQHGVGGAGPRVGPSMTR